MCGRWLTPWMGIALAVCLLALSHEAAQADPDAAPVLTVQQGHATGAQASALSPDGRLVLTGGHDRSACLWEADTGLMLRRFVGHTEAIRAVAFLPGGTQALTAADDVRLWNVRTGALVRRYPAQGRSVQSLAVSADGLRFLTSSKDGHVHLFGFTSHRPLQALPHGMGVIGRVALSPDGTHALLGASGGRVALWRTSPPVAVRSYAAQTQTHAHFAFSLSGTQLLIQHGARGARLLDRVSGDAIHSYTIGSDSLTLGALTFLSGSQLVLAGRDGSRRVCSTETGETLEDVAAPTDPLTLRSLHASADGERVLLDADVPRLIRRDPPGETILFRGRTTRLGNTILSPDRSLIHVSTTKGSGFMLDVRKGRRATLPWIPKRGQWPAIAFSPKKGRQVLVASDDGKVALWETRRGKRARRTFEPHDSRVEQLVWAADGKTFAAVNGGGRPHVALVDAKSGVVIRRSPEIAGLERIALSPDGRRVAALAMGTLRVVTLATSPTHWTFGQRIGSHVSGLPRDPLRRIKAFAFDPGGERVLVAGWDGVAYLLDAATGDLIRTYAGGHTDELTDAGFSPQGKFVLTASLDGTACLWNASTGGVLRRYAGHFAGVTSARFSARGGVLITSSNDQTIRLWEMQSAQQLATLVVLKGGNWAVSDPQNRFDASPVSDTLDCHWVVGNETLALTQLKERYYEPDLLAKVLGFNKEPRRDVSTFTSLALPPGVSLSLESGTLTITLTNQDGGIGRVVVKINGKEVEADARGPAPDPDAKTMEIIIKDVDKDVRVKPGENEVEVVAYNAEEYLSSRGFGIAFQDSRPSEAPSLYAVVAGVSDYEGTALDLVFAAKDALDFGNALDRAGERLFTGRTRVMKLPNAKRGEIVEALETVAKDANSSDIFLLYLSGHGVTKGERFHFLTAEALNANVDDPEAAKLKSLTSEEITDLVKEIPALKQVMILDTCASGGFIDALTGARDVPSSQVRALERVKDRTGTWVLAGCAADKVSYESSRFGQGLLTYCLLTGMRGGMLEGDYYVNVGDLFGFATNMVPTLASEVGGRQLPVLAAPTTGQTFRIGQVPPEDQKDILLATPRPVLTRSRLHDQVEHDDVLGLEPLVDERLRATVASGADAKFVFIDSRQVPNGYRIAGHYTTDAQGQTTVRLRLRQVGGQVSTWAEVAGTREQLAELIYTKVLELLATLN